MRIPRISPFALGPDAIGQLGRLFAGLSFLGVEVGEREGCTRPVGGIAPQVGVSDSPWGYFDPKNTPKYRRMSMFSVGPCRTTKKAKAPFHRGFSYYIGRGWIFNWSGGSRPPGPRRSRHRPLRRGFGLSRSARSRSSSLLARRPKPVRLLGPPPSANKKAGPPFKGGRPLVSAWWRRGESNPRPKTLHSGLLRAFPVF